MPGEEFGLAQAEMPTMPGEMPTMPGEMPPIPGEGIGAVGAVAPDMELSALQDAFEASKLGVGAASDQTWEEFLEAYLSGGGSLV
jgi:hypothetical protein